MNHNTENQESFKLVKYVRLVANTNNHDLYALKIYI